MSIYDGDESECSFDELSSNVNSDDAAESDYEECYDRINKQKKNCHLYDGSAHTLTTSYVSIMLFVMKHSLTKEAFSDLLLLIQTHMPKTCKFTTSVYQLKEFLKDSVGYEEPIKHYNCETCGVKLTKGQKCIKPSCRSVKSKSLVFHDLRLEKQLVELFKGKQYVCILFCYQHNPYYLYY